MVEDSWRWSRSERWTRFESKIYTRRLGITRRSGASPSSEPDKPVDKAADPLPDRRLGPETDGPLKIAHVGAGLGDIAGLHRQELAGCGLADSLLDQPHYLGHLDRLVVADIVNVP